MTKKDKNIVIPKPDYDIDEAERLKESKMKLKAILFCALPVLISFLTFFYFFLNSIVEK